MRLEGKGDMPSTESFLHMCCVICMWVCVHGEGGKGVIPSTEGLPRIAHSAAIQVKDATAVAI